MGCIVICEKPSQARNLRAAIGNRFGEIFAARGHLVQLASPEDVNPDWRTWSYAVLRPPSGFYPLVPDREHGKAEILDRIETALKTAERVIIATDCDREGQAIGENILRFFKYRGDVLRAMFSAEDPETLKRAFADLRPNRDYAPLYQAAVARTQSDQIANLTATRAVTVALKPPGLKGALGVGRVKTPTMAIVCRREREILGFKPQGYFDLWMEVEARAASVRLFHRPPAADRLLVRADADALRNAASTFAGPVCVKQERKNQSPPKLMDLPTLQQRASGWGWSASKTLEVAQTLYAEHKLTTYPRAENRYLPEVEIGNAAELMQAVQTLPFVDVAFDAPVIRKGKSGTFSDKGLEGASHHAIVPNIRTASDWQSILPKLSGDERKLFELVARSYLAAVAPDRIYDRTEIAVDVDPGTGAKRFNRVGTVDRDPGWRAIFATDPDERDSKQKGEAEETPLPSWTHGTPVSCSDAGIDTKTTKPPPRYTEGSLIRAMQESWRFADDPELKARLKEALGIGTPATRASIIEGLKRQLFFSIKANRIIPSELALALFDILQTEAPEFLDPAATAELELSLDRILKGQEDPRIVIDRIVSRAADVAMRMERRGSTSPLNVSIKRKPSPAMLNAAKSKAKRDGVPLPRGAASDADTCQKFLGPRPEGDGPSEAQINFARTLAAEGGLDLPDDATSDRRKLSDWIEANKPADRPAKPPTEKQIRFAQQIAERKAVKIPKATLASSAKLSKWIDRHKG